MDKSIENRILTILLAFCPDFALYTFLKSDLCKGSLYGGLQHLLQREYRWRTGIGDGKVKR